VSPSTTFSCPGYLEIGNRRFKDWDPKGHGTVGLRRSLVESCDVVYYNLGTEMHYARDRVGEHLQEVSKTFGFGRKLGIDLLGERAGLVPTAEWKEERFAQAQPYDRRWFPGDAANLAIGQGFLQVTPLQLAASYGAVANGGTVYKPRVMRCLAKVNVARDQAAEPACRDGIVPAIASPEVVSRVPVSPAALGFIGEAMAGVGLGDGTAAAAFAGFPFERVSVSGKTGTAQMMPRQPFSWFAAFAPAHDPQIVVVALVEEGGTGAQIAAPIVRKVIERNFGLQEGKFEAGARAD
jgi:penicillin-binding protein 2